ncbi:MAG: hypothetical protein GY856_41100 [bacterium]|nr:hypothetical protein [bacterium]
MGTTKRHAGKLSSLRFSLVMWTARDTKDSVLAFLKGMGSVLDIFGVGSPPPSWHQDDDEALTEDWYRIGADMKKVMLRQTEESPSSSARS